MLTLTEYVRIMISLIVVLDPIGIVLAVMMGLLPGLAVEQALLVFLGSLAGAVMLARVERLKAFLAHASRRGVVVELNLFCPFYEESMWKLSPMNAANNVNGLGTVARTNVYTLDRNGGLLAVHEALVRKVVAELGDAFVQFAAQDRDHMLGAEALAFFPTGNVDPALGVWAGWSIPFATDGNRPWRRWLRQWRWRRRRGRSRRAPARRSARRAARPRRPRP